MVEHIQLVNDTTGDEVIESKIKECQLEKGCCRVAKRIHKTNEWKESLWNHDWNYDYNRVLGLVVFTDFL